MASIETRAAREMPGAVAWTIPSESAIASIVNQTTRVSGDSAQIEDSRMPQSSFTKPPLTPADPLRMGAVEK